MVGRSLNKLKTKLNSSRKNGRDSIILVKITRNQISNDISDRTIVLNGCLLELIVHPLWKQDRELTDFVGGRRGCHSKRSKRGIGRMGLKCLTTR